MPDEPVKTEPTADPTKTEPTIDKEALEIGELVKASGFGKGDVNVLTQSAMSLASLRNLIETNPVEFQNSLEKANPEAAKKFEDAIAENYVKKYGSDDAGAGDGKGGDKALMTEIRLLREKINAGEARETSREQAAYVAQVKSRYESRVDDLMAELPKDLALTKTEKAAFRAKLNTDMAQDSGAIERASKGNFVDVPKKFKEIIDGWTTEKKELAEAEKTKRESAEKRGMLDWPAGPTFQISDTEMEKLSAGDDWEANIDAFAKAMNK